MNKYNNLLDKFQARYKSLKGLDGEINAAKAKQAKRAYLDLKSCIGSESTQSSKEHMGSVTPEAKAVAVAKEVVDRVMGEVKQNKEISELKVENERLKSEIERIIKKLDFYRENFIKKDWANMIGCSIVSLTIGSFITFLLTLD
jgi:predicted RNase H-like nuclease (RuvC/YqgF family)